MQVEMNFKFDSEFDADNTTLRGICAVLAGASATTVVADATEKKAVIVPEKVIESVRAQVVEAVKENIAEAAAPAETQAPAEVVEVAPVVDNIDPMLTTEEDMMKASSDTLLKILKGLKIDPNKTEGKNTNKKLRDLILDWRKTTVVASKDDGKIVEAEEEDDEAPAETSDELTPMTYEEAKPLIEPFYSDTKKRPAVQELMKKFGAKKTNPDGSEACSLGALRDKNEDYRPLVEAIKSHKYDK